MKATEKSLYSEELAAPPVLPPLKELTSKMSLQG